MQKRETTHLVSSYQVSGSLASWVSFLRFGSSGSATREGAKDGEDRHPQQHRTDRELVPQKETVCVLERSSLLTGTHTHHEGTPLSRPAPDSACCHDPSRHPPLQAGAEPRKATTHPVLGKDATTKTHTKDQQCSPHSTQTSPQSCADTAGLGSA